MKDKQLGYLFPIYFENLSAWFWLRTDYSNYEIAAKFIMNGI